jgi:electron transport complex protein RnfA
VSEHLLILLSTVLVNNFVLVRFLGLCPFMGVSNKLEGAMGMAVATAFVLTLSSLSGYLVHRYLLTPLHLEYLATLSFILVIAVTVQLTEMFMRKSSPVLYRVLGIFLPLITTNCAVLGVALLNVQEQHNLFESALYGFGAASGFGIVLVLFAAMRERLALADVPAPFRGTPIGLISAGLMALAFMGFKGLANL